MNGTFVDKLKKTKAKEEEIFESAQYFIFMPTDDADSRYANIYADSSRHFVRKTFCQAELQAIN